MKIKMLPKCLKSQTSTLIALLSIIAGLVAGVLLQYSVDLRPDQIVWIALPGELFMRMLTCLSMPLVLPKLVTAIGSMDPTSGGKILGKVLIFYGIVNLIIEITGILIFYAINSFVISEEKGTTLTVSENILPPSFFLHDLLFNMVPDNIFTAPFQRYQTKIVEINDTITYSGDKADNNNILGLVVAATALGMIIAKVGDPAKPLLQFCSSLSMVTSTIMEIVIKWMCPPGLFSLMASQILLLQDPVKSLKELTMFVITVVTG
jgi:Na+/H+-dicarboxylate symporter